MLKKLGRPFVKESQRINKLITFRLCKIDYAKIKKIAKKLKLSLHAYCRQCALSELKKLEDADDSYCKQSILSDIKKVEDAE